MSGNSFKLCENILRGFSFFLVSNILPKPTLVDRVIEPREIVIEADVSEVILSDGFRAKESCYFTARIADADLYEPSGLMAEAIGTEVLLFSWSDNSAEENESYWK